jgi:hypothetical protein
MDKATPADPDQVMSFFWENLRKDKPIELLNYYHGVPVVHKARVDMAGGGFVALTVHPHQAVSILTEKKTYIQSKRLSAVIRATPIQVDIRNSEVILARFTVLPKPFENPLMIRPQLAEPIAARISQGNRQLSGTLTDVSTIGVGVLVSPGAGQRLDIDRAEPLTVSFNLPGIEKELSVEGKISYIRRQRAGVVFRLGIAAQGKQKAEARLREFLASYEAEVLRDLEKTYQNLRKHKLKARKTIPQPDKS